MWNSWPAPDMVSVAGNEAEPSREDGCPNLGSAAPGVNTSWHGGGRAAAGSDDRVPDDLASPPTIPGLAGQGGLISGLERRAEWRSAPKPERPGRRSASWCIARTIGLTRKQTDFGGTTTAARTGAGEHSPPAPTMPHRSVKTTPGGDSHFGPPAIHTGLPAYPQARQRLAAPPPSARWHSGGRCRDGSDPPLRGLGAA